MKRNRVPIKITCVIFAIAGLALSSHAIPTPITGAISFSGTSTIDGDNFVTATSFLSFENVFVGAESTLSGDYVGTSGAAVTVTPFTWSPTTASTPINPLWTFESGGLTYSFDLDVLHEDYATPNYLLLSGFGTAHITGPGVDKLDTSGRWNFSAQTLGQSSFTFSSTTSVPVPDGGSTAAAMGGVLCVLGLMARKPTLPKAC